MNRKMVSLILIMGFIVLLAGCAPTVQPQPQPPTPTTYTIKVISGCQLCYGNGLCQTFVGTFFCL